ncbi:hypothetical protein K9N50_06035 [bacterium]|nr:hypothetical protein [bacterium]
MNCNRIFATILSSVFLIISGCGDPPPDMPVAPLNIGDIYVSISVSLSPDDLVIPDSINVIIDGDNPGLWIDNPDTISDVLAGSHEFDFSFPINNLVTGHNGFIAEVFYNEITHFPLIFEAGSISVTGRISLNDPLPDSIAVVLDGDSLGYHANPLSIPGVLTGSHTIVTYSEIDGSEFIGSSDDVVVTYNALTEVDITLATGGVLVVNATSDSAEVDSFKVILGDNDYGLNEAPRLLSNIATGTYQLQVWFHDDTVKTFGWQPNIEITASETTRVSIEMGPVSPFVGNFAPVIECTDFDSTNHRSLDHLGKVIYFYFFSGT